MTAGLGATKCPPLADGYRRLASTLLLEALADAERGDAEAVAWLQDDGLVLAETLDLENVVNGLQSKFGGNGMTVQKDAEALRGQLEKLEAQRVALERQLGQAGAQETVREVAASIEALRAKLAEAEQGATLEREQEREKVAAELATAQTDADAANAAWQAVRSNLAAAEAAVKQGEADLRAARGRRSAAQSRVAEISNRMARLGG